MQQPSSALAGARAANWARRLARISPGLMLTAVIGVVAFTTARFSGSTLVSPLIVALMLGAVVRTAVGISPGAIPGIKFSARHVLRAGIILLGLQLSISQLMSLGLGSIGIVVGGLVATFCGTLWLGARLRVDARLAQLIATGTSICGASAVVAANTVAGAKEEDVGYAVACVCLFGTIAVFTYPVVAQELSLSTQSYALWAGASIHEIGQVAAAAQARHAGTEIAMIAKLARVALLAPTVLLLGTVLGRRRELGSVTAKVEIPWFVFGFLALMVAGSLGWVSAEHRAASAKIAMAFLTLGLAALGLDLDVQKLRSRGWRPLLLGAAASLLICCTSLVSILFWQSGR